jgi:predicted  nucleic acid-binding Zn-ribbon protein
MTETRPSNSYDPAPATEYNYALNLNWLNRALYYSAGVDVQLLKHCPSYDRVKLQGIGGTVMATAALAFISGSYAFYTVFGPNPVDGPDEISFGWMLVACFFGLVWSAVIYNLDRFIVSTTGHGDGTDTVTPGEFAKALPRIAMAVLIGIVLSKPLEIRIMKTEIDAALKIEQQKEAKRLEAKAIADHTSKVEAIKTSRDDLVKELEKKDKERKALEDEVAKALKIYNDEMDGKAGSRPGGVGTVAKEKKANLDQARETLDKATARLLPEVKQLETQIQAKRDEIVAADQELVKEKKNAEEQSKKLNGLIKRIEIAHDISPKATKFLTAMLIFIEISPLFFKMMLTLSTIDYLTENQKRLARARRGIEVVHVLDANGEDIVDVKNAKYHEADLQATRTVGKLEIDRQLTVQVQEEFTRIVSDDIRKNPGGYVDRLPPAAPPAAS